MATLPFTHKGLTPFSNSGIQCVHQIGSLPVDLTLAHLPAILRSVLVLQVHHTYSWDMSTRFKRQDSFSMMEFVDNFVHYFLSEVAFIIFNPGIIKKLTSLQETVIFQKKKSLNINIFKCMLNHYLTFLNLKFCKPKILQCRPTCRSCMRFGIDHVSRDLYRLTLN